MAAAESAVGGCERRLRRTRRRYCEGFLNRLEGLARRGAEEADDSEGGALDALVRKADVGVLCVVHVHAVGSLWRAEGWIQ